ncbi:MAG: BON domain-containing protein [Deltaproteobacteria bacterium]|nr:BON domain-containing protein [Deltaproteobacteria bacterium]
MTHANELILRALKAGLTGKAHIDLQRNPLQLRYDAGTIIIEGVVGSIAQKRRALLCAMTLEGVEGVVDRLKVAPARQMSDADIKRHFYDAMHDDGALKGCDITIEARQAIIDIEGVVLSLSHKRLAGALAWWVPGSMEVINSLEVEPPEDDSNDELVDGIRLVLEKDVLVKTSSLAVSALDSVVTIEGVVSSEAVKDASENDCWYVWGVNDVINNLRVEKRS